MEGKGLMNLVSEMLDPSSVLSLNEDKTHKDTGAKSNETKASLDHSKEITMQKTAVDSEKSEDEMGHFRVKFKIPKNLCNKANMLVKVDRDLYEDIVERVSKVLIAELEKEEVEARIKEYVKKAFKNLF